MPDGGPASILKIYSGNHTTDAGILRDHGSEPEGTSAIPDFGNDLNQAFQLLEEIRAIFESRQTYVLHTLLDLIAIEIRLMQQEQRGYHDGSERDNRQDFPITWK